jgi:hypothetical protein
MEAKDRAFEKIPADMKEEGEPKIPGEDIVYPQQYSGKEKVDKGEGMNSGSNGVVCSEQEG